MSNLILHNRSKLKNETSNNDEKRCQNSKNCKCCSGLCIDLLTKFEDELGFTYELVRTEDPKFGIFEVCFFLCIKFDIIYLNFYLQV